MEIDEKTIEQLTKLAMIELSLEEKEAHRSDLEKLATFAGTIGVGTNETNETNGGEAEGGSCVPGAVTGTNRLREDVVTNEDLADELLAGAPDSKGPYLRVPRTVDE